MIVKGVQTSGNLRFGLTVQGRVIGAVLMREIHTRFGRDNIGYLWMFVEPMLLASAISGFHLAVHVRLPYGMDVVPFYLCGYTPFLMFRQIVNRASQTIESNRTLLYHRQISLFDLLFARALLDFVGTSLAMFTLLGVAVVLDLGSLPDRPLYILVGLCLMFWISFAFSLPIAAASEFTTAVDKLVHPVTYIMMPLSGVFFLAEMVPPQFRTIILWGPIIHITQLIRMGQFGNFDSQYLDIPYLLIWCVVLTFFGMLALGPVPSTDELGMISLQDVTKFYPVRGGGRRCVLDRVSLEVQRGQSIGIMGRNGSGKSTLVKVIGGAIPPTSGTIRRDMTVSWPLGFVGGFQSSLSGADNIRFIARLYGVPWGVLTEFVEDFAEIGDYIRMPVRTYSSGMCARLTFGISLALEFDCYLIDEATAVGDARFQDKCERALLERRERGSLIMVSHSPKTLRDYCDMGAIITDGRLTIYDDLEEAIETYEAMFQ